LSVMTGYCIAFWSGSRSPSEQKDLLVPYRRAWRHGRRHGIVELVCWPSCGNPALLMAWTELNHAECGYCYGGK
jgi:hypothetical protein